MDTSGKEDPCIDAYDGKGDGEILWKLAAVQEKPGEVAGNHGISQEVFLLSPPS